MTYKPYTVDFGEEAVRQVTQRGYSVAEVSSRLGISTKSLYKWIRDSKQTRRNKVGQADIARLKCELKQAFLEAEHTGLKRAIK